ncbi:arabinogalactan oligomer / maltooligosaccharide transport system permease protein [Candidatus Hakubella thermalkaliphila]|uniref:Arabinogalactan oligomer / maltooligosaccharide transport system permease protein n=2 Tax=Candidatus Hakubella thermalkaliphila TaxID=2754717 RepID=A0A6V8Q3W1_9ACTN|nr:arabinogalactan oligomer / maltooligosaccharide transport system permease protein [Candidatus Hakubella thermalkaliphila]
MGVITFYPMGFQLWMSFTNYGIRNLRFDAPPPDWVGLANYVRILTTNLGLGNFSFWRVLGFNLFWAFSNVIIHVTLGIMIAVVLNTAGLWFKRIYRVIYILPIVIPQIIVANVFRNMFVPDWGALNQGLALIGSLFGLSPDLFHIRWIAQLGYPISGIPLTLSYFALLITNIWLGWPFMTIVATGALQSIPHELYGAADIDGASGLQKFWRITLPLIRPAMVPAAVYGLVVTFNLFTLIYFLSGGGPLRETEILLTVAFRLVNEQRLYGLAAAFSVYIFFVLLGLTLLTNYITRATESYEI